MLAEAIRKRLERAGDASPGAFNLAADIVQLCGIEASRWTYRADDAVRIPDMLFEAVGELQELADRREPF